VKRRIEWFIFLILNINFCLPDEGSPSSQPLDSAVPFHSNPNTAAGYTYKTSAVTPTIIHNGRQVSILRDRK